jgi:predicted phage terminase large subunit-like protein
MDVTADRLANFARGMQRLKLLEDAERCEERLIDFVKGGWKYIDPAPFKEGWHLEAIAEHLQAVTDGDIRRLVINVPPRTSKSSLVSVAWPAWTWAQSQEGPLAGAQVQFLFASYAQSLSLRDSVKSRRLISSPWYQQRWGSRFVMTGDVNTKGRFENDKGGYRLATSVGGALTGEGGAVIVVDDPHNALEVESEAIRESTLQWWDESLSTRLNDPVTGAYVIIMQRLYEDDLTGHILSKNEGEWVHLMLPMRYEPARHCHTLIGFDDPRTDDGELLWRDRFPEEEVVSLEKRLGPFASAGQLQQMPTPRGGGILKRDWWQLWGNPEDPDDATYKQFPSCELVIGFLDTAYTEKQENDYSALTVWGLFRNPEGLPKLILMNAWRDRLTLHDLVERSAKTCRRFKLDRLLIEAKASGISVAQELRRLYAGEGWGIQTIDPGRQDKVARAYAAQPVFADAMVYAPDRDWADMVITECASFPKAPHDDLVDTVTGAILWLRDNGFLRRGEEVSRELTEAMVHRSVNTKPLYGAV